MSIRIRIGPFTIGRSGLRLSLWRKRGGISWPLLGRSKNTFGIIRAGPFRWHFSRNLKRRRTKGDGVSPEEYGGVFVFATGLLLAGLLLIGVSNHPIGWIGGVILLLFGLLLVSGLIFTLIGKSEGLKTHTGDKGMRNATIISHSKRYDDKSYRYWWDICDSRKKAIAENEELILVQKDSGQRARIKASQILPLLTEKRRTSRCRSAGRKGNWGLYVRCKKPNQVEVEGGKDEAAQLPVKWE